MAILKKTTVVAKPAAKPAAKVAAKPVAKPTAKPMKKAPTINVVGKDRIKNYIAKQDTAKAAKIDKNVEENKANYKKASAIFESRPNGMMSTPAANEAFKKARQKEDSLRQDNGRIYKTIVNKDVTMSEAQKEDRTLMRMYGDLYKKEKELRKKK